MLARLLAKVPNYYYLWTATIVGSASNSIISKLIDLGEQHLVDGRNPISLCNVLLVGNICALAVMLPFFSQQLTPKALEKLDRKDWINLVVVAILSGAIAPGSIFAALDNTSVTNVVLIGRLESPINLALNVWLLRARVSFWTAIGSLACFLGVAVTAFLSDSEQKIAMMGGLFHLGKGEIQAAIASLVLAISAILGKSCLQRIPVGFFSVFRTGLGAIVFFFLARFLYGTGHFAEVFAPFLWRWTIIYGVAIVAFCQLCWLFGLRNASSAQITTANSSQPIAAIFMAYLILREVPTAAQYWGGSIIILGIILSSIGNFRQRKAKV